MSIIFRAENLSKFYNKHCALDQLSVEVPTQSIFGLLGPNGAGKTTLIRIINQIIAPDSGKLYLDNRLMKPDDVHQIGYLPEERGLYKKMQVGEQATYLAQLKGLSAQTAKKELRTWFEKFDLMPWWNKKVEELSKGMQQKVQFIVTVLHKPRLLIFDEPFSGFDPINVNLLKQEIIKLKNNGSTILFSTHDMGSVEELCDHIALINKSRKILDGSVDAIKREYSGQLFQAELENTGTFKAGTLDARFEQIGIMEKNGIISIRIRAKQQASPNDLLRQLIGHSHVVSFREIVPSMNDIFIKHVTGRFPGNNQDTAV